MKKSIVAMITSLMALILLMVSAQRVNAAELPTLTVVDSIQVDNIGVIFNVTIELTIPTGVNVTNLKGLQIKLGYDTSILDCINVELLSGHPFEGLTYQFAKAIEDGLGYAAALCITMGATDCVNVTETKPLFNYVFNSTELGESHLTFLNVNQTGGTYMINVNGEKIPIAVSDGIVNVINEFSSTSLIGISLTTMAAISTISKYYKKRK